MYQYLLLCILLLESFNIRVIFYNATEKLFNLGRGVYIKDIWVLNLDRRTERYDTISKMLNSFDLSHSRISAIDGMLLTVKIILFHRILITIDFRQIII